MGKTAVAVKSTTTRTGAPNQRQAKSKAGAATASQSNATPATQLAAMVDDRTADMTVDALACRGDNHWWKQRPSGSKRRAQIKELLDRGLLERSADCRQCGAERRQLVDIVTYVTVSSSVRYPEGYLLKEKGSGRLLRREAKRAFDCR